jgi:hypothetical protein
LFNFLGAEGRAETGNFIEGSALRWIIRLLEADNLITCVPQLNGDWIIMVVAVFTMAHSLSNMFGYRRGYETEGGGWIAQALRANSESLPALEGDPSTCSGASAPANAGHGEMPGQAIFVSGNEPGGFFECQLQASRKCEEFGALNSEINKRTALLATCACIWSIFKG